MVSLSGVGGKTSIGAEGTLAVSGVGGETSIGAEGTLAVLADPMSGVFVRIHACSADPMSGVFVRCGRRDQHWNGRHACSASGSNEWCLCQVWEARPALERKARLQC